MYKEMRRKDRAMSDEQAKELLITGEYGILSTIGIDCLPYAVPLSYVVIHNNIFIHCAQSGQKLNNLLYESHVCFCVVGKTCPVYDNNFTTYYESVIVYGQATKVDDKKEKTYALMMLANKYLPDYMDKAPTGIAAALDRTTVIQISIDHITGKKKWK